MLEARRINVSTKRQITIPQKFFEALNIGNEVECFIRNNEIVIRPIHASEEFSEEILRDLIKQGYQGEELLQKFREMRSKVRPAIQKLIEEAEEAARNFKGTGEDKMNELFSDVEED
jgi:bifunctional DNA-binding transcriptional regulator/antitoxin component of YhaV-PrlF toxin-antitoxin module